jgi:hypothetical protein
VENTQADHGSVTQHGYMTFAQFLTVSAATLGLVIIVVMAAIPFLTDERGRSGARRATGGHRHLPGPAPRPPRETV